MTQSILDHFYSKKDPCISTTSGNPILDGVTKRRSELMSPNSIGTFGQIAPLASATVSNIFTVWFYIDSHWHGGSKFAFVSFNMTTAFFVKNLFPMNLRVFVLNFLLNDNVKRFTQTGQCDRGYLISPCISYQLPKSASRSKRNCINPVRMHVYSTTGSDKD